MCQGGEETYGRRQSEAVSGVQPGHVPAVNIRYTWDIERAAPRVSVRVFYTLCVLGQRKTNIKDDFPPLTN